MGEGNGHVSGVQSRPGRSPLNERKYGEILEVAGRLFARKGFDGTSLQDIAVDVGVLKGSLYHYISSKEDLLADIVREGQKGLQENIELCDHFVGEPIEQLAAFAYGHIRLNATPERLLRGIVFLRDGEKLNAERRKVIVQDRDRYDHYLRTILADGQRQGMIDPEVQPRISSFAILGVLTSYIRWYDPEGQMGPDELGREFASFALAAVRNHRSLERRGRFELVDEVVDRCRAILSSHSAGSHNSDEQIIQAG